jgi:hypothetical protein
MHVFASRGGGIILYYAVLAMHPGTGPGAEIRDYTFTIFTGQTKLAAIHRAREWVVDSSPHPRADHEEEHGAVTDDEWVKIMHEAGFIVVPADLHTDE